MSTEPSHRDSLVALFEAAREAYSAAVKTYLEAYAAAWTAYAGHLTRDLCEPAPIDQDQTLMDAFKAAASPMQRAKHRLQCARSDVELFDVLARERS